MQRDKAINIFLGYILYALVFLCFFPVYFSYGMIQERDVSIIERLLSLFFALSWLAMSGYFAWFRKRWLMLGAVFYAVLAYIPGWVLASLPETELNGFQNVLEAVFSWIYQLVNAPMVGVSLIFPKDADIILSKWLLPILVLSYIAVALVRFYRKEYLAEQLHIGDEAYYPNHGLDNTIEDESEKKNKISDVNNKNKNGRGIRQPHINSLDEKGNTPELEESENVISLPERFE